MSWLIIGSLIVASSLSMYVIGKRRNARVQMERDEETFVCRFDPTKASYRAKVDMDTKVDIRKNLESETFDKYGIKGCSEMVVIANDIETVKEYLSNIIEKRIDMPNFPKSIRFEWTGLPDEFVLYYPKDGQVVKAKDLSEICKNYGTSTFCVEFSGKNKAPGYGRTTLETPEEYESRLRAENIKKEEDRCKKLLQQLEDVQDYDEARMKEEREKERREQKEREKRDEKKRHSIGNYSSVQAAISANSGGNVLRWW